MDPTTLGIIIGLAGIILPIIVAIIIAITQVRKREITYSVLALPLISIKKEIKDVEIKIKGAQATNPYLVVLRVWNSGNHPINKFDFNAPIKFNLGTNVTVLDKSVLRVKPVQMKDQVNFDVVSNMLTLNPILMNKGFSLYLKLFLDNYVDIIAEDPVIYHINHLQKIKSNKSYWLYRTVKIIIGICLFLFAILPIIFTSQTQDLYTLPIHFFQWTIPILPFIMLFLLVYYLLFSFLESRIKKREEQRFSELLS